MVDDDPNKPITGPMIEQAARELIDKCDLALVDPDKKRKQVCNWDNEFWKRVKHVATEIINGRR